MNGKTIGKNILFTGAVVTLVATILALAATLFGSYGQPVPPPAGQVYAIQTGTTLYWVEKAMNGATGTFILQNKVGDMVIMWNMKGQGLGFTLISKTPTAVEDWYTVTGGRSNLANYTDARSLKNFLVENGWKVVAAKDIARAVKYNVILNVKLIAARISGSVVGVGIYVLPGGSNWKTIITDGVELKDA